MAELIQRTSPEQLALEDFERLFSVFPLSDLNGKRLFITGGTGFFGFWLLMAISYLNSTGANILVTALSRNPQQFLNKNPFFKQCQWLSFCHGDITDYSPPSGHFDLFIHGATDTSPASHQAPLKLFTSMIHGAEHVFEHAQSIKCQRVLVISSGAVYDNVNRESDVNSSPYAEGKKAVEALAKFYGSEHKTDMIIARCFAFIGFRLPKHLAIHQFIEDAVNGNDIRIKGNGRAIRSYLYGADLAIWLLAILVRGNSLSTYNVGSDCGYTLAEHADRVIRNLAPEQQVIVENTRDNSADKRNIYVPEVDKANKELGLNVWTELDEAIKKHGQTIVKK